LPLGGVGLFSAVSRGCLLPVFSLGFLGVYSYSFIADGGGDSKVEVGTP
jgi:hypothetical protein